MLSGPLKICFLLLMMSGLLWPPARARDNKLKLNIGETFPTLALTDLNEGVPTIVKFKGKKTILHVFASW